jgi:hypothetical protein
MITELEIVRKYLGVEYHPQKMNCWMFVKAIYSDLGRPLVDIQDFLETKNVDEVPRLAQEYKDAVVSVEKPELFDMVMLSIHGKLHAGIVLSKGRFIHLMKAGAGVCKLGDLRWWSNIIGYYRQVA